MLTIKNELARVIVLKAFGKPDLRIFPGYNAVDVAKRKELDEYLGNKATQGLLNGYVKRALNADGIFVSRKIPAVLFISGYDELDSDEKKEADVAKEKNDLLNKSALVVKKRVELKEKASGGVKKEELDALREQIYELKLQLQAAGIK